VGLNQNLYELATVNLNEGRFLSQTQLERHLSKVGTVSVGRFDPQMLALQFGSIVTPNQIDLETPVWNNVPAYLS
jgi:hypothetical protein